MLTDWNIIKYLRLQASFQRIAGQVVRKYDKWRNRKINSLSHYFLFYNMTAELFVRFRENIIHMVRPHNFNKFVRVFGLASSCTTPERKSAEMNSVRERARPSACMSTIRQQRWKLGRGCRR